ncbi:hypothetical protein HHI36_021651, partial [Cryptolaemus montrouzieri]
NLWPEPIDSLTLLVQLAKLTTIMIFVLVNGKNSIINYKQLRKYQFGMPSMCKYVNDMVNRYGKWVFRGMKLLVCLYMIYPTINKKHCDQSGLNADAGFICGLAPMWFPFKVNFFPMNFILQVCVFVPIFTYYPIISIYGLAAIRIAFLILFRVRELTKVITRDLEIGDGNYKLTEEKLIRYIKHHQEIMK